MDALVDGVIQAFCILADFVSSCSIKTGVLSVELLLLNC